MFKSALLLCFLFFIELSSAHAMPPFIGNDYSGEYLCKGKNDSVGDYEVLVTLKLNSTTSHDIYGIYDFNTETNKQTIYAGQMMAKGRKFAMTFTLLNTDKNTSSTGMGDFRKMGHKRWRFQSTYYEPDGHGGNFGSDSCTMMAKQKTKNKTTKKQPNLSQNTSDN